MTVALVAAQDVENLVRVAALAALLAALLLLLAVATVAATLLASVRRAHDPQGHRLRAR